MMKSESKQNHDDTNSSDNSSSSLNNNGFQPSAPPPQNYNLEISQIATEALKKSNFLTSITKVIGPQDATIETLQTMQFRTDLLYRNESVEANQKNNSSLPFYTVNGARFLKPLGFGQNDFKLPENFTREDFQNNGSSEQKIVYMDKRTTWQSVKRGLTMLLMLPVLPYLLYRAWKAPRISNGYFSWAKNDDQEIEIYPKSPSRRIGLSWFTNISEPIAMNNPYINIDNQIHVVNVPVGRIGVATLDNKNVFLPAGRHLIKSSNFILDTTIKTAAKNEAATNMNTQNNINNNGQQFQTYNQPLQNNETNGVHDKSALTNEIFYLKTEPVIKNGTSYIINVPEKQIGYLKKNGKTYLLENEGCLLDKNPDYGSGLGAYVFDDDSVVIGKTDDGKYFSSTGDADLKLDQLRVKTISGTKTTVIANAGKNEFLKNGRYALLGELADNKQMLDYDTTENTLYLTHQNMTQKFDSSEQYAKLEITACLRFVISDPALCHTMIGHEDYQANLRIDALSALSELISKIKINRIIPDQTKSDASSSEVKSLSIYDPTFAREQLTSSLGGVVQLLNAKYNEKGIKIVSLELPISLLDLSPSFKQETEAQILAVHKQQRESREAEAREKTAIIIARTLTTEANANADVTITTASAAARAEAAKREAIAIAERNISKMKAEQEAENILRLAQATADALILQTKAAEIAALSLAQYPELAAQLEIIKAQGIAAAQAFQQANITFLTSNSAEAVEKILSFTALKLINQNSNQPNRLLPEDQQQTTISNQMDMKV